MDGIEQICGEEYSIYYIKNLSDEVKKKISDELVALCYGEKHRNSPLNSRSFKATLGELLDRYPDSSDKRKGFIGELLLNIIIRHYLDYSVVSPFFNMEEKSVKKGFDIILFDDKNQTTWITESKAGEVTTTHPTIDKKIEDRIDQARLDLINRLNDENNTIWQNALNNIDVSMHDGNEKDIVQSILDGGRSSSISNDKNVILGGIVFHSTKTSFLENTISKKTKQIINQKNFSQVRVIAIQKETYFKVYQYLKDFTKGE